MDFVTFNRINRADPRMVRKINLHSVFSVLREKKSLRVSEISRLTGLSISTVKSVLNNLFEMNLLIEGGEGSSTGGRKPALYTLNLKDILICGIELHSEYLKIGFLRLDGKILWKKVWTIQTIIPEELSSLIKEKILKGCQELKISYDSFIGVGICVPGFVDLDGKTIMLDVQLGWEDVSLGSMLQEVLHLPVFLVEEANAKMIAEIEYGMAKNIANFLYLVIGSSLGKGIGGGLVINKGIVKGSKGFAGEVGHMLIKPNGPVCSCGRKGCWEAVGSISRLIEKVNEVAPELKIRSVQELAPLLANAINNSNKKIEKVVSWFIDIQAEGIANLIHIFNPEFIIIGGVATLFGELFLKPLRGMVKQKIMRPFQEVYRIELSKIENNSAILGAAAVVLQQAISIKQNALL